MTKLRPYTIPSSRPITVVTLVGAEKPLVLAHAESYQAPLVVAQKLVEGLYLPHYDDVGVQANSMIRDVPSRITVDIAEKHNVLFALTGKKMRSGRAQCLSMAHARDLLMGGVPIGRSAKGNHPLQLINGYYPDPVYARAVIDWLQDQLSLQAAQKSEQLSLPVVPPPIPAAPVRIHSREQLDELLHALDAKRIAIRDANNKLHHAQEAERAARQAVAAEQKALTSLEGELEEIKLLLQGGTL